MFENYERITDRNGNVICINCPHSTMSICDSDDCANELRQRLNRFENALEDGRLIDLTEDRITALMACLHGTSTDSRLEEAIYTKFNRNEGKINVEREMSYKKAIEVLMKILENIKSKD